MFRVSAQLTKENHILKEHNEYLKEYLKSLEKINK